MVNWVRQLLDSTNKVYAPKFDLNALLLDFRLGERCKNIKDTAPRMTKATVKSMFRDATSTAQQLEAMDFVSISSLFVSSALPTFGL